MTIKYRFVTIKQFSLLIYFEKNGTEGQKFFLENEKNEKYNGAHIHQAMCNKVFGMIDKSSDLYSAEAANISRRVYTLCTVMEGGKNSWSHTHGTGRPGRDFAKFQEIYSSVYNHTKIQIKQHIRDKRI